MSWIAERVRAFYYEELYLREYPKKGLASDSSIHDRFDRMGFFVAGFSAGADHAEVWSVEIDSSGRSPAPALVFGQDVAGKATWAGDPEALNRLFLGFSGQVRTALIASGIAPVEVDGFLNALPMEPLIASAMPLQDAIDLVKYMVDATVGFVKFRPGPSSVAEPIDIAAITKHEGFRWVRRKHYFSQEMNPTA